MAKSSFPFQFVFFIIVLIIGIKTFLPALFDKTVVRGSCYSVKIPEGWSLQKQEKELIFTSPNSDVLTGMPDAVLSIYCAKEKNAIFMEDFFPEMLASLQRENGKVLSTGDELIDKKTGKRVVFRYNKPDIGVVTIYLVDDYNFLTRIQFVGQLKSFKEYGNVFDQFKKTIKFKR